MRIGQFWRFKNFMRLYYQKDSLTINSARLKFVRNLIMRSGSDPHKAHK